MFILKFIKWCIIAFLASTILAVLIYKWMPIPFTPLMGIRYIQSISNKERTILSHKWISLEEMPSQLPLAVIASEDQHFMQHHGFDFDAIKDAMKEKENGGRQRGASTISQQTAKNVFLWPSASWLRKGLEAYFTILIELLWSKERIMEVYLNSIEMGKGIYGIKAVANAHFNKFPQELRRRDCALIAATLPNPLKYSSKNPSPYMQKRQQKILREMRNIESSCGWNYQSQVIK